MNLYYELTNGRSIGPLPDYLAMNDTDVLQLLQTQIRIGLWRSDLETGHTFCSAEAARLFGLPEPDGPINFGMASMAIHPEDEPVALELIETTAREKGAYQMVMRVMDDETARYRYVRVVGRYRDRDSGGGELIGICHEIPDDRQCV
ncbi:MAG TPA: PAS domain-containing protein [Ensifer sp.]|nr:PAS domain-containing protein [Ensifer sp.]